ncbi:hypothetical protein Ae406Ps2_6395c [Pseudonocardia sp. Ae406_Ps2]|nr:hypothetical protein Ae406Ps2_6395c [Pseudonocardia sp. Ae406_Ps2]
MWLGVGMVVSCFRRGSSAAGPARVLRRAVVGVFVLVALGC